MGGSFRVPAPSLMERDLILINGFMTDLGIFFKLGTVSEQIPVLPHPTPPRLYIKLNLI